MLLTKDGITVDVVHPSDIKRYKSIGYVEEVSADGKPKGGKAKATAKEADKAPTKEGE